jgi:excisionase family DNA binding protein
MTDQAEHFDSFLTLAAVVRRTGLGRRQLRAAIDNGELTAFAVGGWLRVRWVDVQSWIESRRVCPESVAQRGAL